MQDEEDLKDLEIEVPADDAQEAPKAVEEQKVNTPAEPAVDERDAALEELKSQIEAHKQAVARERAGREEAERRARENETRAQSYQAEAQDGRLTAISNAIRAVQSEADSAERSYADALASGDHQSAAKAQRVIASMEARLLQLENGKAAIEEQLEASKGQPQKSFPVERQAPDPIEAWADTLSSQSASWVREHRDAFRDPAVVRRIGAAHSAAVELEGIQPDTPEYFAFIETRIGLRKPERPAEPEEKPSQPRSDDGKYARKPVPAAPVASGGPSAGGNSAKTITLSAEMREIAASLFPDLPKAEAEKKYAQSRALLMREGKISS